MSATVVEPFVMDYLRSLASGINEAAETVSIVHLHRANSRNEYDRLTADLARAEAALVRLAVGQAERPMPLDLYARSHRELADRVDTLRAAAEVAGAQARRAIHKPAETAAGLLEAWDTLPVRGRREILAKLLDCVVVKSGRPPRLLLVPAREVRRELGE